MRGDEAGRRPGDRRPRLFHHYPLLAEQIAWLPLGVHEAPVERLRLPGHERADSWVKRDDLTATDYGGNKPRKLEFLLAEARRHGAARLLTVGAAGSHHALATALYGTRLGLNVSLVLFPQRVTAAVEQTLLIERALGAELRFTPRMETVPLALAAARLAHRGGRLALIPPGGSNAIGTLGYVDAALELADQIAAGHCPAPAAVYVAGGTLGTAAGLALGFTLAGLQTRVVAARITSLLVCNQRVLTRLLRSTLSLLARAGIETPSVAEVATRVQLRHEFLGRGYSAETEAGEQASQTFARAGLMLDRTYTAKAAAAFMEALSEPAPGPLLFWHTFSAAEPPAIAGNATVADLPVPFQHYLRPDGTAAGDQHPRP